MDCVLGWGGVGRGGEVVGSVSKEIGKEGEEDEEEGEDGEDEQGSVCVCKQ